jgi:probable HAF family extracellular repeat protein
MCLTATISAAPMILIVARAEDRSRFGACVSASANSTEKKSALMHVTERAETVHGNIAFVISNRGQIAGKVRSADGSTYVAPLWQPDGTLKILGFVPGDHAAFATGINDRGQVVGNSVDSSNNWSHGFIWQNDVMTDLNTLIPAESNLSVISASNINDRGQISGMATVVAGPHTGDIHAFLATPDEEHEGRSIADVLTTQPKLPAHACNHLLRKFGRIGFDQ